MNIFMRQRDDDLFKYLDDGEVQNLLPLCHSKQMKEGEWLEARMAEAIVVLESGRLERVSAKGRLLGEMSVGELDLEAGLFSDQELAYRLYAASNVQLRLFPYSAMEGIRDSLILAKLHAAINDSLCLKTVRLTHMGADDDH